MRVLLETAHRTLRCWERKRKHAWAFRSFVLDACASDSVRGTIHSMKCAFCNKALPQGSSSRKRFCDDAHRASYWRQHTAESPKSKRGKELSGAKSQVGASGTDKPGPRKPQIPRVRPHTVAHSAARVPMAAQLNGLAPEGAVGYRLVLPTRTPDDVPRLSPPLDASGYQGHYSLRPFQAPFDIRLTDGQTYRVVWIGASGEVIPPKPDGTIPGLHFFLTSGAVEAGMEAASDPRDSQSAHSQTETARLARVLDTIAPALQQLLTSLTALSDLLTRVDMLHHTPLYSEVIADTKAEQATSQESIAAEAESQPAPLAKPEAISSSEDTAQHDNSKEPMGVPPQTPLVHEATIPSLQIEAPQSWDEHLLSEEDRQWAIRWALNEERVTLLFRALLRRVEGGALFESPTETDYTPRAEDIKDLARVEGNAAIAVATAELHKELMRAPLANPTGDYPQPRYIPSLTDFQKQTVLTAFRSPEQSAHFGYLLRRRDALRLGGTLPTKPKSSGNLSREARRKLEKLFEDTRATALMAALHQQALSATEHPVKNPPVLPPSLLSRSMR